VVAVAAVVTIKVGISVMMVNANNGSRSACGRVVKADSAAIVCDGNWRRDIVRISLSIGCVQDNCTANDTVRAAKVETDIVLYHVLDVIIRTIDYRCLNVECAAAGLLVGK